MFLVTTAIADKIKHIHFQKESKNLFLPTISILPLCSQSAQPFQPLANLHTVTQPTSFVPGHSYGLSADESNCLSGMSHNNSVPRGLFQCWYRPVRSKLSRNARPYGSGFARENRPSLDRPLVRRGVGPTHQLPRNASSVSGLSILSANIRGHHVLVHSDSRSVVSYINHQGGLVSKRLCTLANDLLVWTQNNLRSLMVTHVPGKMNQGADMLSRNNVSSEEKTLHPLTFR